MKISILIPAYNEKDTIREVINKVLAVPLPLKREIIIVDDGSTDGTSEVLRSFFDNQVQIIPHDKNYGKGRAIRTALQAATGDICIIQDADLEYDPNDYIKLITPILEGKASVVYGNRRGESGMRKSYNRYYWGGRLVTAVTNLLYGSDIHDEPVCYKVFMRDILKCFVLKCNRFEFCPEFTAKVCKSGYKIYEVPISYDPRGFTRGKKITWFDGLEAIWTLLKYRFID